MGWFVLYDLDFVAWNKSQQWEQMVAVVLCASLPLEGVVIHSSLSSASCSSGASKKKIVMTPSSQERAQEHSKMAPTPAAAPESLCQTCSFLMVTVKIKPIQSLGSKKNNLVYLLYWQLDTHTHTHRLYCLI